MEKVNLPNSSKAYQHINIIFFFQLNPVWTISKNSKDLSLTVPCPGRNANMTGDLPHLTLPTSQKTSIQSGVLLGLSPQVSLSFQLRWNNIWLLFQMLTEDVVMTPLETVPENSAINISDYSDGIKDDCDLHPESKLGITPSTPTVIFPKPLLTDNN